MQSGATVFIELRFAFIQNFTILISDFIIAFTDYYEYLTDDKINFHTSN
jgi:hypothetical protein